jgi:hypothetical protein
MMKSLLKSRYLGFVLLLWLLGAVQGNPTQAAGLAAPVTRQQSVVAQAQYPGDDINEPDPLDGEETDAAEGQNSSIFLLSSAE